MDRLLEASRGPRGAECRTPGIYSKTAPARLVCYIIICNNAKFREECLKISPKWPGKREIPGLWKIFFFPEDIKKHGLRRFNATRGLWCAGYLPYGQPADYLDILKGVEKQLGGTNVGIRAPASPLVVPHCL